MAGVKITGPLFDGNPSGRIQSAAEDVVRRVTELGMQHLTSPRPDGVPVKTGNYRRNVHMVLQGTRSQIDDSGVVYGPWLEGTGSRNEKSRFKGYSTFRRGAQWLQEKADGECRSEAQKLARELGGG